MARSKRYGKCYLFEEKKQNVAGWTFESTSLTACFVCCSLLVDRFATASQYVVRETDASQCDGLLSIKQSNSFHKRKSWSYNMRFRKSSLLNWIGFGTVKYWTCTLTADNHGIHDAKSWQRHKITAFGQNNGIHGNHESIIFLQHQLCHWQSVTSC